MNQASIIVCCIAVDDRTDEGMAESKLLADLEQTSRRRGVRRVGGDPQTFRRGPDQARVPDGLRSGHEKEALALSSGPDTNAYGSSLRCGPRRRHPGQPEPARQGCGRPAAGQLEHGERVAARLSDDPIADGVVEPPRHRRREQRASVRVAKRRDRELGHTSQLRDLDRVAPRKDQYDGLTSEPAGDEAKDLGGGSIQPLRIIQQAHQWLPRCGFGEQRENGETDQEAVRRVTRVDAEGGPSASRWGAGKRSS